MALHQKLGNTILMITHDVDEAVLLSDRIVMMTNGPSARIGEVLDVPLGASAQAARTLDQRRVPEMPATRAWNSSTSGIVLSRRRKRFVA